jgi:hypothetical protein
MRAGSLGALALVLVLLGAAAGCRRDAPLRNDAAEGLFSDVTAPCGIEFQLSSGAAGQHYLVETMLGGLGWIDYDGDGDMDLYLANGHEDPRQAGLPGRAGDRLYQNDGEGRFRDATAAAGIDERRYSTGVAVADYDNDGDSDLLVTSFGRNTLYRNSGAGTFEDVTAAAGLAAEGFNASAAWFDYDRDGDLDLYIARYLQYDPATSRGCVEGAVSVYCHPRFFHGQSDLLYKNQDGRFADRSREAGVWRQGPGDAKGLGVIALDYDRDGWVDVYVANDTTPNFLWRNLDGRGFRDVAPELGVAVDGAGKPQAGMGVDWGDVNGDGFMDIHVTNFSDETNNLYVQRPGGGFEDAVQRAGLGSSYGRLGFGTLLGDFDLDGDLDLVVANGHVDDSVERKRTASMSTYKQPPDLFLNDGSGRFTAAADLAGAPFRGRYVARGLASADFDDDGDLDLAMMTLDQSLVLLRNNVREPGRSGAPHYLRLKLVGAKSPRDAYGAVVEVEVGRRRQVFEYQSARSYLSAVDPRLVIGLGAAEAVDRIRIRWPSGGTDEIESVPADQTLVITEER